MIFHSNRWRLNSYPACEIFRKAYELINRQAPAASISSISFN